VESPVEPTFRDHLPTLHALARTTRNLEQWAKRVTSPKPWSIVTCCRSPLSTAPRVTMPAAGASISLPSAPSRRSPRAARQVKNRMDALPHEGAREQPLVGMIDACGISSSFLTASRTLRSATAPECGPAGERIDIGPRRQRCCPPAPSALEAVALRPRARRPADARLLYGRVRWCQAARRRSSCSVG